MCFCGWEDTIMNTEEKKKCLREIIENMNAKQISKLYQLIRGMLGKVN